jgi:HJR/Mrr/RecB family endonuclease
MPPFGYDEYDDEEDEYGDEEGEDDEPGLEESQLINIAEETFHDIIDKAEMDASTGEVVLNATTPEGILLSVRLHSLEELREFFQEFGFNDTSETAFGYSGKRKVEKFDGTLIDYVLESSRAEILFQKISAPGDTLFRGNAGLILPEVKIDLASVNEELLKFLAANPHKLHTLEPRRFEELIRDIFRDFGYEVLLTPPSRDGGFDIRAIKKDSVGMLLYLIECKRYAPERPVGVDVVRGLYGVTNAEGASCGIVATTSRFTRDAREFADKIKYKMSLRDYNDLVGWLKQYPVSKKWAL